MGFSEVIGNARGATESLEALAAGTVDVVLMESSLALPLLTRERGLEVVATLPEVEQYGMAVAPGSDLRESLNAFLSTTRRGRSFYQLVLRYLGEQGVELLKVSGGGGPQTAR
jgi:ABC-type amino acid transport substrate-binding protein